MLSGEKDLSMIPNQNELRLITFMVLDAYYYIVDIMKKDQEQTRKTYLSTFRNVLYSTNHCQPFLKYQNGVGQAAITLESFRRVSSKRMKNWHKLIH